MCELRLNVCSPEEDPPQPPPPQPADDQGPPPTSEETTQPPTQDNSGTGEGADAEPVMEPEEPEEAESEQGGRGGGTASVEPRRQRLTWQSLESQRRRFNYDVIPKACDSHVVSCDGHVMVM